MERSPEFSQPNPAFSACVERMEGYASESGLPYNYRPGLGPNLTRATDRQNCDVLSRVGTVMIEDVAARQSGTPIMYDVHIFTESGRALSGLSARLTKHLEQFETNEVLDFTVDGKVMRSYVDHRHATQGPEQLSADEVTMLAEQLETLGSIGRPL